MADHHTTALLPILSRVYDPAVEDILREMAASGPGLCDPCRSTLRRAADDCRDRGGDMSEQKGPVMIIWRMPPEPPEGTRVRDRDGRRWKCTRFPHASPTTPQFLWVSDDGCAALWLHLLEGSGPLTEEADDPPGGRQTCECELYEPTGTDVDPPTSGE